MQTLGIVGPGSVLDSKLVMENEKDGDLGADWLNTNSAGSGKFDFEGWKANDRVILTRNDDYWGEPSAMKRIIMRHIPEIAEPAADAGEGRHRHRLLAGRAGPQGAVRGGGRRGDLAAGLAASTISRSA